MTALRDEAAVELKHCRRCDQTKPITEFYEKGDGQRQPMCRDCDNARPRTRTISKILRVRARHRATGELVRRHDDEFRDLLEYFTDIVHQEAALIDEQDRSSHDPVGAPRLLPGQRRKGQEALDRINEMWVEVGKCSECSQHHEHGHACTNCGADPGAKQPAIPDHRGTCSCPHAARRHSVDEGCLIADCPCSGYPEEQAP